MQKLQFYKVAKEGKNSDEKKKDPKKKLFNTEQEMAETKGRTNYGFVENSESKMKNVRKILYL